MKLNSIQIEIFNSNLRILREHSNINGKDGFSIYTENEIKQLFKSNQLIQKQPKIRAYRLREVFIELETAEKASNNDAILKERLVRIAKDINISLISNDKNDVNFNGRMFLKRIIKLQAISGLDLNLKYDDIISELFSELYVMVIDKKMREGYTKPERSKVRTLTI